MKMMRVEFFILWTLFEVQTAAGEEFWIKREHSLVRPYQNLKGLAIPNWDFFGNTIVTDRYIRLVSDRPSQYGGIWNSVPVRMVNWEAHIQFRIHGKNPSLFGDGIAFWYVKDAMIPGSVFGSKDYFYGLGVFIDTYSNFDGHHHTHPYISAMVNNGTLHYDHDKDGTNTQIGGCESPNLRNSIHDTWISVRYDRDTLTVSTYDNSPGNDRWAQCIKVEGVILATNYFIGLTSATGELFDNHDLITVHVYELPNHLVNEQDAALRARVMPAALHFDPTHSEASDPYDPVRPAAKFFIVALSVVIALAAVGLITFTVFENRDNARKRFYY